MKVYTLLENTSKSDDYIHKHGLSLYIETENHKILFDMGPDDTFIKNAKKLNVNLSDVDIAIVSHGHMDHGGGLKAFMEINKKARIILSENIFDDYFAKIFWIKKIYIGLDKALEGNKRFEFVNGTVKLDDEVTLFNQVPQEQLAPKGNRKLYMQKNGKSVHDEFNHELNLIITENDNRSLFCGCAHNGVINIIQKAKSISENSIQSVIGGFHLMGTNPYKNRDREFLFKFTDALNTEGIAQFYTGHCTGATVFNYLESKVDNLQSMSTGDVFII